MSFGVNKCATNAVKSNKFKNTPNYVDPTFYIGISFDEDLSLKPILSIKLTTIAPLLSSNKNKNRTSRVQSLINPGILWCINSFSGKGNSSNKKNKAFRERNSYISLFALPTDQKNPSLGRNFGYHTIKFDVDSIFLFHLIY
ncbi:hypothetical protein PIROE2DRAFT_8565 [Piromyces sp. E2]|nr:hypothetical protein PIROE2DRAFT_8565 [Piromyces sp. E2]|eukprot:OUM64642.1 hypothetical protein PIROE2DRAFT_8565 [Piromyces sp. E2]